MLTHATARAVGRVRQCEVRVKSTKMFEGPTLHSQELPEASLVSPDPLAKKNGDPVISIHIPLP